MLYRRKERKGMASWIVTRTNKGGVYSFRREEGGPRECPGDKRGTGHERTSEEKSRKKKKARSEPIWRGGRGGLNLKG